MHKYLEIFFAGVDSFLRGDTKNTHIFDIKKIENVRSYVERNKDKFKECPSFVELCALDHKAYHHNDWISVPLTDNMQFAVSPHGRFTIIFDDGNGDGWKTDAIAQADKPYQFQPPSTEE